MIKTRLMGIILIVVAVILAFVYVRTSARLKQTTRISGGVLATQTRQILKSPVDSVLAHLEPLRRDPPSGTDLFLEFLKGANARGEIAGGFVEVPLQALMDPADTNFAAAEAYGPMAVTTPLGFKIPPPESLEDYIAIMEEAAQQGKPLDGIYYFHMESPPYSDWVIRAYISPHNDKVHMMGLAFDVQKTLSPGLADLLSAQLADAAARDGLALELLNASDQTAYTVGNPAGKKLIQQQALNKYDPGHSGWAIKVWSAPPSIVYLIVVVAVGVIGIVLVIL